MSLSLRCRSCGEVKPHRSRADSPRPRTLCIDCEAARSRAWRESNWQRRKLRDTWRGMIDRCHNPERMRRWAQASGIPDVRSYAGAGVSVCARWRDPERGLAAFASDVGPPPTKAATLDRRNPHRNYTPSNCRWADPALQAANRKNARFVAARGLRLTLSEWGRRTGIDRRTIAARLDRGWPPERALTRSDDPFEVPRAG